MSSKNNINLFRFKGEPARFLHGHGTRLTLNASRLNGRCDVRPAGHSTPCWLWRGKTNDQGYGITRGLDGRRRRAHVVAYESVKGPVPDGLEVDHLCGNRRCINPDHLEAVTHRVNVQRGRRGKLSPGAAQRIKQMYATGQWTHAALAREFGVSKQPIHRILVKGAWT